jgi:hypothetical protein
MRSGVSVGLTDQPRPTYTDAFTLAQAAESVMQRTKIVQKFVWVLFKFI